MAWFSGSSAAKVAEKVPDAATMKDSKADLVKEQGMVLVSAKAARTVLHDLHVKNGKLKMVKVHGKMKGGAKGGKPSIYEGNLTVPILIVAGGGGVFGDLISSSALISSSDFGSYSALFDTMRCSGIRLMYQPFAAGAAPNTGVIATVGNHVPVVAVFDPELTGTMPITFAQAVNNRDWTDKRNNVLHSTDKALDHTFHTPTARKLVAETKGAMNGTLGDWMDIGSYTSPAPGGGVSFSTFSQSTNANIQFGYMIVTFLCQWSYRL